MLIIHFLALPANADPFPNWLLQLLGANVLEETEAHDEPHFYCQGDGLGVHPSIMEVDVEEDLSSSESTSSQEDAAENTISENEINEMFEDIPYEDVDNNEVYLPQLPTLYINSGRVYTNSADSNEEFFDTIDHPSPRQSDQEEYSSASNTPRVDQEEPSTSNALSNTDVKLTSVETNSSNSNNKK